MSDTNGLAVTRSAMPSSGVRVALAGELDLCNAAIADVALRDHEQDAPELLLDLRGLTFMDAAGLAVVVHASRRARRAGRALVVNVRSGGVRRLFELTRTDRFVDVIVDAGDGMGEEPFALDVVRDGSAVWILPIGDLDLAARPELDRAIDDALRSNVDRLVLDLRRVSFLDSSGLRLALELHTAARLDGFTLEIVPGPAEVQRVFEVTGTLDALPFVAPREE